MLLYAITDRRMFAGNERDRQEAIVTQACRLAAGGISILQLREKDLPDKDLEALAARVVEAVRTSGATAREVPLTRVILNGPAHIAVTAGAAGVHLRGGAGGGELGRVRQTFKLAGLDNPIVSVSCHSVEEVRAAAFAGFEDILFGPVFEKCVRGHRIAPGLGLDRLRQASEVALASRLIALGGVTDANAHTCLAAGAAGIAGIRIFSELASSLNFPGPG